MKKILSYQECTSLKGLSMLLIVLHNLLHAVTPYKENEKFFDINRASFYINNFSDAPVMSFIGYFGWIGVAVFVFLTGYGLSIKYKDGLTIKGTDLRIGTIMLRDMMGGGKILNSKALSFVFFHYKKLLLLVFIPYVVHLLAHFSLWNVACMIPDLLFVRNIFSYPSSPFGYISVGTYWYLGLCFELYVYFALCHKLLNKKWFALITLGLSLASITLLDLPWIRYCKFHFIGWLPAFYLGYYVAKINVESFAYDKKIIILIVSLPLYIFSSLNSYLWFISDIFGILCFITTASLINNKLFRYVGSISSCLFVCHPLIRDFWKQIIGANYMNESITYVVVSVSGYVFVCLVLSHLYNRLLKKIYNIV